MAHPSGLNFTPLQRAAEHPPASQPLEIPPSVATLGRDTWESSITYLVDTEQAAPDDATTTPLVQFCWVVVRLMVLREAVIRRLLVRLNARPDWRRGYLALASIMARTDHVDLVNGRRLDQKAVCSEALRLDPRNASATYQRLGVALDGGETALLPDGRCLDRKSLCMEALRHDPRNGEAYHTLGLTLEPGEVVELPDGRRLDRTSLYIEAIRHQPTLLTAYADLGSAVAPDEIVVMPDGRRLDRNALFDEANVRERSDNEIALSLVTPRGPIRSTPKTLSKADIDGAEAVYQWEHAADAHRCLLCEAVCANRSELIRHLAGCCDSPCPVIERAVDGAKEMDVPRAVRFFSALFWRQRSTDYGPSPRKTDRFPRDRLIIGAWESSASPLVTADCSTSRRALQSLPRLELEAFVRTEYHELRSHGLSPLESGASVVYHRPGADFVIRADEVYERCAPTVEMVAAGSEVLCLPFVDMSTDLPPYKGRFRLRLYDYHRRGGIDLCYPRDQHEAMWGRIEQICQSVLALHATGRSHGNLTPSGILVTDRDTVLLADPSIGNGDGPSGYVGSVDLPPRARDCYAVAVITIQVLHQSMPEVLKATTRATTGARSIDVVTNENVRGILDYLNTQPFPSPGSDSECVQFMTRAIEGAELPTATLRPAATFFRMVAELLMNARWLLPQDDRACFETPLRALEWFCAVMKHRAIRVAEETQPLPPGAPPVHTVQTTADDDERTARLPAGCWLDDGDALSAESIAAAVHCLDSALRPPVLGQRPVLGLTHRWNLAVDDMALLAPFDAIVAEEALLARSSVVRSRESLAGGSVACVGGKLSHRKYQFALTLLTAASRDELFQPPRSSASWARRARLAANFAATFNGDGLRNAIGFLLQQVEDGMLPRISPRPVAKRTLIAELSGAWKHVDGARIVVLVDTSRVVASQYDHERIADWLPRGGTPEAPCFATLEAVYADEDALWCVDYAPDRSEADVALFQSCRTVIRRVAWPTGDEEVDDPGFFALAVEEGGTKSSPSNKGAAAALVPAALPDVLWPSGPNTSVHPERVQWRPSEGEPFESFVRRVADNPRVSMIHAAAGVKLTARQMSDVAHACIGKHNLRVISLELADEPQERGEADRLLASNTFGVVAIVNHAVSGAPIRFWKKMVHDLYVEGRGNGDDYVGDTQGRRMSPPTELQLQLYCDRLWLEDNEGMLSNVPHCFNDEIQGSRARRCVKLFAQGMNGLWSSGSGFVAGDNGDIVTCAHLFDFPDTKTCERRFRSALGVDQAALPHNDINEILARLHVFANLPEIVDVNVDTVTMQDKSLTGSRAPVFSSCVPVPTMAQDRCVVVSEVFKAATHVVRDPRPAPVESFSQVLRVNDKRRYALKTQVYEWEAERRRQTLALFVVLLPGGLCFLSKLSVYPRLPPPDPLDFEHPPLSDVCRIQLSHPFVKMGLGKFEMAQPVWLRSMLPADVFRQFAGASMTDTAQADAVARAMIDRASSAVDPTAVAIGYPGCTVVPRRMPRYDFDESTLVDKHKTFWGFCEGGVSGSPQFLWDSNKLSVWCGVEVMGARPLPAPTKDGVHAVNTVAIAIPIDPAIDFEKNADVTMPMFFKKISEVGRYIITERTQA